MKRLVALSYVVGLPMGLGLANALPAIVALLLFSNVPPVGVLVASGLTGLGITAALFSYFVSGFFPTTGGIGNFIMGL